MNKLNISLGGHTAYAVTDQNRLLTITGPVAKLAARWLEDQLDRIDRLFYDGTEQSVKTAKKVAIEYCEVNFSSQVFVVRK